MSKFKFISHDETTGEHRVTELHPLYGEVDRPARKLEIIVDRARVALKGLIQKADLEQTPIEEQPATTTDYSSARETQRSIIASETYWLGGVTRHEYGVGRFRVSDNLPVGDIPVVGDYRQTDTSDQSLPQQ